LEPLIDGQQRPQTIVAADQTPRAAIRFVIISQFPVVSKMMEKLPQIAVICLENCSSGLWQCHA
jgi:hypothetical protein